MAKKETVNDRIVHISQIIRMADEHPDAIGKEVDGKVIVPDHAELIKEARYAIEQLLEMRYVIREAVHLEQSARFAGAMHLTKEDLEKELKAFD